MNDFSKQLSAGLIQLVNGLIQSVTATSGNEHLPTPTRELTDSECLQFLICNGGLLLSGKPLREQSNAGPLIELPNVLTRTAEAESSRLFDDSPLLLPGKPLRDQFSSGLVDITNALTRIAVIEGGHLDDDARELDPGVCLQLFIEKAGLLTIILDYVSVDSLVAVQNEAINVFCRQLLKKYGSAENDTG
jgi:hypothetical protein